MTKKLINEYDDTKRILKKIRTLNESSIEEIKEQISPDKEILNNNPKLKEFPDEEDSNWISPEEKQKKEQERLNSVQDNGDDNMNQNSISNYWKDDPKPESQDDFSEPTQEGKDFAVINNVEVVLNSTDELDHELKDEEKTKISQLIDDFREEVSEIAEFGKLQIYPDSAKLDGNVGEENIGFMLSAGDDSGMFLTNSSMLRFNEETRDFINKLETFQIKFNDVLNEIIANRQQN